MSIVEAPSDELMTAGLLATGARGTSHTETRRPFTMDEFSAIVGNAKAAGG